MRVANKLTPEPKSKTTETKPKHKSEQFQDKTLQLLVPNSKRLGGYTQMDVLFSLKKRTSLRRSQEALHGFAQKSTQTTLVPTQQDLKEQDEAPRTQP